MATASDFFSVGGGELDDEALIENLAGFGNLGLGLGLGFGKGRGLWRRRELIEEREEAIGERAPLVLKAILIFFPQEFIYDAMGRRESEGQRLVKGRGAQVHTNSAL